MGRAADAAVRSGEGAHPRALDADVEPFADPGLCFPTFILGSAIQPPPVSLLLSLGSGLADGQDRAFRMARCQLSVSAVGDEVEDFEHSLADQDLAPRGSHDGLGSRGEVSDLDCDVRHGSLFPAFVRVDDGSRSPVSEP